MNELMFFPIIHKSIYPIIQLIFCLLGWTKNAGGGTLFGRFSAGKFAGVQASACSGSRLKPELQLEFL
jgi:hypothetical protein